MCKRRITETRPQVGKRQTTKMLPRPNPNHPSLSSERGKSRHLGGREGTVLAGCGDQAAATGAGYCGTTPAGTRGGGCTPTGEEQTRPAAPPRPGRPLAAPRSAPPNPDPGRAPRLTSRRRKAARPGPSPASCSADARGRSDLTRGGERRAWGRWAPSSPPLRDQCPAPRGPREDQRPGRRTQPPHGLVGVRQPCFPGRKKKMPPPTMP